MMVACNMKNSEGYPQEGTSPRIVTSQRSIKYRKSAWGIHQFEIWSGELVCKVAALRVEGSLLLWIGGGGEPVLGDVALGVPAAEREGLASALLGAEGAATAMARRLAAALQRPVYVCSSYNFDRFSLPLIERGLISEIKNRPQDFGLTT